MNKPPCIRGLQQFKKGCPCKPWDGEEGCPAWVERIITKKGKPLEKINEGHCLDMWQHILQWDSLGLLEGNQMAIESFRNNMTTTDGFPKPDPALVQLLSVVKQKVIR